MAPKGPLSRWSVQIILYLTTSLLNNAAFAYDIPMSVHIVLRPGGLVINMLLGWAVQGRKYTLVQAVLLVTVGVVSATLFAQESSSSSSTPTSNGEMLKPTNFLFGVSPLCLTLVLPGLMAENGPFASTAETTGKCRLHTRLLSCIHAEKKGKGGAGGIGIGIIVCEARAERCSA